MRGGAPLVDGHWTWPGVGTYDRAVFTEAQRMRLREELVTLAEADEQITAAALVGSAARDQEDRWSDIDLALRLAPGTQPGDVVEGWTSHMYASCDAKAHVDVWSGKALYRVFLLESTLQVDLSFWPAADFASTGGPFRLLFGEANPAVSVNPRSAAASLGMAWLYALHARSSIARGRVHQALHMLNGMRDELIRLACLRAGLPADQGRGVDDLPGDERERLGDTVVRDLEPGELVRAFARLTEVLLQEAVVSDAETAQALGPVLTELVRSAMAPMA